MNDFLRHRLSLNFLLSGLLLAAVVVGAFSALVGAQSDLRQSGQRIDVAGRQRMLTQQIALQALTAVEAPTAQARAEARGYVDTAVLRMRTEHDALVRGNASLGLEPSGVAAALYLRPETGLDDLLADYWADARIVVLAAPTTDPTLEAVERLRRASAPEAALPTLLNEVVGEYSAASAERAERLHHLIQLVGALLVAAVAAVLVPLGLALRREQHRLLAERSSSRDQARFLETLLDTVDVGIIVLGPDARPTMVNRRASELHAPDSGVDGLAGVRARVRRLDGSLPEPGELFPVTAATQDGREHEADILLPGPDGDRYLTVRAAPLRDAAGEVVGAIGATHDVTAFQTQSRALHDSVAFHDAVIAATPDVLAVIDLESESNVWVSGSLTAQVGYQPAEVAAMGSELYQRLVHPEDLPKLKQMNAAARGLRDGQVLSVRYRIRHANGSMVTFQRRVTPFLRDQDGTVRQVLVLARDVSESVRMEDELRAAALHDSLTGLPNRRLLADRLDIALKRTLRAGQELAVLFVDLDGFKGVNDTGGHESGDDVLRATAERLSQAVRPHDTVARVGGDEFVVLLEPGLGEKVLLDAAEMRARTEAVSARLVKALAMPVISEGGIWGVTASIGIAFAPPGASAETVLRDADRAMYAAKSAGKNRRVTSGG